MSGDCQPKVLDTDGYLADAVKREEERQQDMAGRSASTSTSGGSVDEKQTGIIGKYRVERVSDPEGKHSDCWYFVLDPQHDPIAREALLTYATEARDHGYQALHDDILDRLAGTAR